MKKAQFLIRFSLLSALIGGSVFAATRAKATVELLHLDGCGYVLRLENGEVLEPMNLAKNFQVSGLKVVVTYTVEPRASICMAGQTVVVNSISAVK